jgi:uncharacterized protein YecE (DUF72 family)
MQTADGPHCTGTDAACHPPNPGAVAEEAPTMDPSPYRIGCSGYGVDRDRYRRELDFVELQDTRRALPNAKTVARMRAEAPAGFAFGLVAPEGLCDPDKAADLPGGPAAHGGMRPTPANIELLDRTLETAAALGAIVRIHTTSDLVPGPDGLQRFRDLLAAVDRRNVPIAWEQRGVLRDKEMIRWAEQLDLLPVLDPFQDAPPPGPHAFIRIHPFMTFAGGLHADRIVLLAERLAAYERGWAVFDTPTAFRDAVLLKRMLAGTAGLPPEREAAEPGDTSPRAARSGPTRIEEHPDDGDDAHDATDDEDLADEEDDENLDDEDLDDEDLDDEEDDENLDDEDLDDEEGDEPAEE